MADNADVAVFPPALVGGSLLLAFGLQRIAPMRIFPRGVARALGAGLTASAIAVAVAGFRELRNADTPIDVREPTRTVVTTGIYGYTRNPLYLGLLLMYLGLGSLRNSGWHWLLAAPTAAVLQMAVIAREEAYLERKFDGTYVDYKTRVRRWL
ncbi:MAG TPA: isoprenylcysteine carboxylmethyltransferase family protein [Candidatus Acidoferrum sp.]|nr:isoprenylcysteine carboxylmethyltransferase family protein [Candidatus Acidoferrum sp.]